MEPSLGRICSIEEVGVFSGDVSAIRIAFAPVPEPETQLTIHDSSASQRGASPWSVGQRIAMVLWEYTWFLTCQWTPKPANAWRLMWLRVFGAKIEGRPFVHSRARIQIPWNIHLADGACVGDRTNLYSLDQIRLGENCVIAQEAYLCTGTHDLSHEAIPLMTAPIVVGEKAFIGARAFLMPGVTIGARAVVGACAVVTRNVDQGARVRGNPAKSSRNTDSGEIDETEA